jgi:hypothetical protein
MKKLLVGLCITASFSAMADEFTVKTKVDSGRCTIFIKGTIIPKLTPEFEKAVEQLQDYDCNEKTVNLNSGGGNVFTAMTIGNLIRNNNYSTVISLGSHCSSACIRIFIAGTERIIEISRYSSRSPNYQQPPVIGFHSPGGTKNCITVKENSNLVDEKYVDFQVKSYNYAIQMLGHDPGITYAQIVFQIGCNKTIYADPEKLVNAKIATSTIKSN